MTEKLAKTALTAVALIACVMFGGIAAAEQHEKQLNPRVEQRLEKLINEKLANAILITDKECTSFGTGWQRYELISGRFAIAAGKGKDDRGETKEYTLRDRGGEYAHQLTVPEMPAHDHRYGDVRAKDIRADYGDDEPTKLIDKKRTTDKTGGGNAHNNMPPYLALNFCHFSGGR